MTPTDIISGLLLIAIAAIIAEACGVKWRERK